MTTPTTEIPNPQISNPEISNPQIPNLPTDHWPLATDHSNLPLYPGELSLLIGHPGTGKSLLSLDLAARLAANAPLPPAPFSDNPDDPDLPPPAILLLSAENQNALFHAAAFHIHPDRLLLPDPTTTTLTPDRYSPNGTRSRLYNTDSPLIRFLRSHADANIRLIILDPLPAFLGPVTASASTLLSHLQPLLRIAAHRSIPILGISHLAKSLRRADPSLLPIGSLGYSALARSILLLSTDPEAPPISRLLTPIKNNFAPINCSWSFTFSPRQIPPFPTPPAQTIPTLPENPTTEQINIYHSIQNKWQKYQIAHANTQTLQQSTLPLPPSLNWNPTPIPLDPAKARGLHPPGDPRQERIEIEQSKLDLALEFLQATLKNGPLPSKTVYHLARDLPLSKHTLDRARLRLKIRPTLQNTQWLLSLPKNAQSALDTPPTAPNPEAPSGPITPPQRSTPEHEKNRILPPLR